MRKSLKLILTIVMTLSMVMMLTGCGSNSDTIVGKWETTMDLSDMLTETIGEKISEYIVIDDFSVNFTMTFNEDGTYSIVVERDSVEDAFENVKEAMSTGLDDYVEAYIAENGLSMTVEEYWTTIGMTKEELIDTSFSDEMIDAIAVETEGNYKAEEGKLYTTDDPNASVDGVTDYEAYELSGDELTLTEYCGEDEGSSEIYPITFTRAE